MTDVLKSAEDYLEAHVVEPVKEFLTRTAEPDLEAAWAAAKDLAKRNGGALLAKVAEDTLPLLLTMQWGAAIAKLISDAEAAGVEFIEEEKNLAASTALQIAQAASGITKVVESPNAPADAALDVSTISEASDAAS